MENLSTFCTQTSKYLSSPHGKFIMVARVGLLKCGICSTSGFHAARYAMKTPPGQQKRFASSIAGKANGEVAFTFVPL